MKKTIISFYFVTTLLLNVQAQSEKKEVVEEVKKGGLKKENLFVGGNVGLGFGSGNFSLGLGPYFGYSINKYVDVALGVNYNYISQRDYYTTLKQRQSILGPSAFVRLYPVKFLFAQAQYEYNFIKYKNIYGNGIPDDVRNLKVPSFLLGPGFASGRSGESKSFYYISVLFDLTKNINSPYTDNLGRITPIIRAGFNVALFQGDAGGRNRRPNRRRF